MKAWWKRLSRKTKIISIISIVLVLCMAGTALAYHFWYNKPRQKVTIDPTTGKVVVTNDDTTPDLNGRINILLIGIDERQNQLDHSYRTDTLILASIDPQSKRIALLSIPRDSRVQIPQHGWDKINAAAAYGGLNTTVAVVQQLTGVSIDGYIKTNFDGFKSVVDTLGGITVDVEKNMYYLTGDKTDGVINLKKGVQVLNGTQALEYARFRHDALADISRTARQQTVLKAIAKKMMQPATIPKIPALITDFSKAVDTNLPLSELVNIGLVAVHFDSSNVISQTLPGYFLNLNSISYWGVDPDQAKKVTSQLFDQGQAIGNSPEELIQASNNGSAGTASSNKPVVPTLSIGHVTVASVSSSSVTLSITASNGIDSAQLFRDGQLVHSWPGGAITFTDSGLSADTAYGYQLKVLREGNVLQASSPLSVTTKQDTTVTPPTVTPTAPELTITSPGPSSPTSPVKVKGTTDAKIDVTISVTDSNGKVTELTVSSDSNGSFSATVSLTKGTNTIKVVASDPETNLATTKSVQVNYQPTESTSSTM